MAGVALGALVAPHFARIGHDPTTHLALVSAVVILGGAVGNFLGWLVGTQLRARTGEHVRLRRVDAVGGSIVSVVALLAVTWFLALNLANGPFPGLARGDPGFEDRAGSRRQICRRRRPCWAKHSGSSASWASPTSSWVCRPRRPHRSRRRAGRRRARRSERPRTARSRSSATVATSGYLNQGSGFVVRPGYVITNAHVVAGTTREWIHTHGTDYPGQVVAFDPREDLALLHVPALGASPLPLLRGQVGRGAGGAVVGYPGGGPLTGDAAAVRRVFSTVGRDIYGHGEITRQLYEIQAVIRHGNSGGPFILANGQVAGVVFASSVVADDVGYAITSTEVSTFVRGATGAQTPVSTGTLHGLSPRRRPRRPSGRPVEAPATRPPDPPPSRVRSRTRARTGPPPRRPPARRRRRASRTLAATAGTSDKRAS